MYALIGVLVEDGRVLLFGGNDSNLASELEGTLNNVVGDDVKLLLLLALKRSGMRSQKIPATHYPCATPAR